mmetsp:Transcript_6442/g.15646  ORF Transcript_6442/g.15646 Transcript_6442/m.15646 type:complete len:140 (-) Transcript_6442:480-899(-)
MATVDESCPCKKTHRSISITDATLKATGMMVLAWTYLEHQGPNPPHHGSQVEGPNHAARAMDPYTTPSNNVRFVLDFDTMRMAPLSSTKQHPQQQIVDSAGSDAQIQRIPRKAFRVVSIMQRMISESIANVLDVSFCLL